MENITQIVQKVKQAPWRVQRQWLGLLLLGLVLMTMVAGVYLQVTTRAAINGRQIQLLADDIEAIQQGNADMEVILAGLTSSAAMQERAEELGFHPATTDEITYVAVAGYVDNPPVDLSIRAPGPVPAPLKAEYYETLFDWFTRQMASGALP